MKTYKEQWLTSLQTLLNSVTDDYVLSIDYEEAWNVRSADLVGFCTEDLNRVIRLEIVNCVAPHLVNGITSKVIGLAERIEAAKRYNPYAHMHDEICEPLVRLGRAGVCYVLAFARAMLHHTNLDSDLLLEASQGYEFYALSASKSEWDEPVQWDYHTAVFLALANGDITRASTLMALKRSFKWTQAMHDPLHQTIKNIANAPNYLLDPQSPEGLAFQDYFDDMRNPDMQEIYKKYGKTVSDTTYAAFHLALVKERFVTGNLGAPNWRRVFESIAE